MTADQDSRRAVLGSAVANVGDVNADGNEDLVLGDSDLRIRETEHWCEGRVYAYFGPIEQGEHQRMSGAAARFDSDCQRGTAGLAGKWIAPAGDVNGDGVEDTVVAALDWSGETSNPGRGYLLYGPIRRGRANIAAVASVVFVGFGRNGEWTAYRTWGMGDMNDDGFDDLLVNSDSSSYLFFGPVAPGIYRVDSADRILDRRWRTSTTSPHRRQLVLPVYDS